MSTSSVPQTEQLQHRMGIHISSWDPDCVAASMPVEGNRQPYGLLHGGANAVLAETVGSIAAAIYAGPERIAVGLELSCTHHRAVRSGQVHAVAKPVHTGGSTACYEIVVTDDEQRRTCTARLSCLLRQAPAGS